MESVFGRPGPGSAERGQDACDLERSDVRAKHVSRGASAGQKTLGGAETLKNTALASACSLQWVSPIINK